MPRQVGVKNYFNFSKGYITESSQLNYAEGSCVDIDNMNININGTAYRRIGIDYEASAILSSTITQSTFESNGITVGTWGNVGGNPNLRFAVIQIGSTLFFHNLSISGSLSSNLKNFTVNLEAFKQPNSELGGMDPVQFESAKGYLVVSSNNLEPFYITYNSTTDSIATTQIVLRIRDLVGVVDGLSPETHPASLSVEHRYNLLNQGWDDPRINALQSATGSYPSNSQQWFVSKDSNQNFDPNRLNSYDFGTGLAPKGRYILDAFLRDRNSVSALSGLPTDIRLTRPSTVLFYAGRVLYAGQEPGVIYISKIIQSITDFGVCYQEADPTSEQISDLIATDGIHLQIPECGSITKLVSIKDGVLIFAINGIWQLRGDSGPFTATNQSVIKITDISAVGANAITLVEGVPVFVSESGIYTLEPDKITSLATPVNLTINTVQTYFDSVTAAARANSFLLYNQYSKQIAWLHNKDSDYTGLTKRFQYNALLIYNVRLQAFYKYSMTSTISKPYILGGLVPIAKALSVSSQDVVVGSDTVQVSSVTTVIPFTSIASISSRALFLTGVLSSGTYRYTFSQYKSLTFKDWISQDGIGVNYSSFIEPAYVILDDVVRTKQAQYIYCYFNRTELNYTTSGSDLVYDNPSSCYARVKWNFADSTSSGKWTSEQQVYRFRQNFIGSGSGSNAGNGLPVVLTRSKFRGCGKSLTVHFRSEEGKDFQLLGWATPLTVARAP